MALGGVGGALPLPVTEDMPPDLLAGSMDLRVLLPGVGPTGPGAPVSRISVERSTPMMDLLVQLARAHKMAPAGHTLQAFGFDNQPLNYQPSTPVGALDVFTVKMVPKTRSLGLQNKRAAPRPAPAQPFEQTFRLQVHLPRNQLYVTRASRATVLGDIRRLACSEKNLDPNKYELRHPANLDRRLEPEATLGEVGLTEVALVAAGGRHGPGQPDIMALRKQEEKRRQLGQQAARAGQFGCLVSHSMVADGSVSSASSGSLGGRSGRSTSPAASDGSSADRSTSPPQPAPPVLVPAPPNRPGRKRRPAPKPPVSTPPSPQATEELNNNINKETSSQAGPGGTVISHSRNSSDSSGYHEASVLSESPEGGGGNADSLARRSKMTPAGSSQPNLSDVLSRSMTNLTMPQLLVHGSRNSIAVSGHGLGLGQGFGQRLDQSRPLGMHASTSALSTAGQRKKKAPPPPPPVGNSSDKFLKTQSLDRQTSVSEALAQPKSNTLPSACAAFAPVSSSSCSSHGSTPTQTPTPTPSLSESTPTVGAPRPVPRSVCPAIHATGPVPRPRPRKPPAPNPPMSPLEVSHSTTHTLWSGNGSFESSVSVEEETCNEMEASISASALDMEPAALGFKSQGLRPLDGFKSGTEDAGQALLLSERRESDSILCASSHESVISSEGIQSPARGVPPLDWLRTLNMDGEEVDSDFAADETHSPGKLIQQKLVVPQQIEEELQPSKELVEDKDKDESDIKYKGENTSEKSLDSKPLIEQLLPPPQPSSQLEEEWEYRLPSPPSAFRDARSDSPTVTDFDTVTLAGVNLGIEKSTPSWETSSNHTSQTDRTEHTELSDEFGGVTEMGSCTDNAEIYHSSGKKDGTSPTDGELSSRKADSPTLRHETIAEHSEPDNLEGRIKQISAGAKDENDFSAPSETVNSSLKCILPENIEANQLEIKKLNGPAAVLNELQQVLTEQRIGQSTVSRPVLQHSESAPQPAPINNFSLATYTRPHSTEGMPPLEVRPSLVLARRSSFSNSNGNLSSVTKPAVVGVRRTTSHATLVGHRRENHNNGNGNSSAIQSQAQSEENLARNAVQHDPLHKGAMTYHNNPDSLKVKSLGSAVSETNLNSGLSIAPSLEPELLREFMEWRQLRQQQLSQKEKAGLHDKLLSTKNTANAEELQTPQVLRSVLPQLSQTQSEMCDRSKEKVEPQEKVSNKSGSDESQSSQNGLCGNPGHEEKTQETPLEPVKKVIPRGPPSIQLSTWSERPKRQVSIKMDRDYWIGVGGAALRHSQQSLEKVDGPESLPVDSVSQSGSSLQQKKVEQNNPPKEAVQRLTRQFIAHATPSGYRRSGESPSTDVSTYRHSIGSFGPCSSLGNLDFKNLDKPCIVGVKPIKPKMMLETTRSVTPENQDLASKMEESSNTQPARTFELTASELPLSQKGDPSRIPIVRAVELKKPLQQPKGPNSSVVYFTPANTSSVSAKYVPISGVNSVPPVKKFTSVVDISGPAGDIKTVNGNDTTSQSVRSNGTSISNGQSVHVNGFLSHSEPKKKLPMPVVKGFKLAQGSVGRQLSAPAATPPPPNPPVPPPQPAMPVLKKVVRPTSLPPRVQDPRDQLLDAIRNFGGRTNLRPTT